MQNRKSASVISKAACCVVESMEKRTLFSQVISVSTSQMVFNAVANSSPSQIETETITNTGDAALTLGIGSTILANDPAWPTADNARFTLINGAAVPATLAPGASFALQVQYTANAVTTNSAYLDISSDDPINPTLQIQLRGIGTKGLGGSNQPSLATILEAYNIPTLVGDGPNDSNALADNVYPYPPDPSSQEVVLQTLQKAGSGPVTIKVLASFTASGAHPYTLGMYPATNANNLQELFTTPSSEYQSVYVQPTGTTTFDPGSSPFGFYCISNVQTRGRVIYTQDALNTFDSTTGRHFRFFPMETPTGTVVPNEYIMTSTEWNAPIGYDFTNIVAIVSNVKAATGAPTSPAITLTDANALPNTNNMIFNRIQSPNSVLGDIVHDTDTLTVSDTGESPLVISSYSISSGWQLSNPPTFPLTIAPGASVPLTVKFIQSSHPSVPYNETNGPLYASGGGVLTGNLTFTTNDPNNPTISKPMAGWWQLHSENENEPSLQSIVNLIAGWTTVINSTPIPDLTESVAGPNSVPTYYGNEVVSGYWQEADPGNLVTVRALDSYHTEGNSVTTYYYPKGGSSTKLFSTVADTGQTFFPYAFNTTTPAIGTFSNSGTFGFRIDNEYSDDSKNTANNSGGGHHIRFYPIRNSAGQIVPNTYLMCLDYSNIPQNFDFQDNVYIVSNIKPANETATPTDLWATSYSTGNFLSWSPIFDSTVTGYNVYRTDVTGTVHTLLTPTPITNTTFFDSGAASTGYSYYKVTAVSSSGGESPLADTVTVANDNSGGTTGGTGDPVAANETVNTQAGNPVTINEFPDATDTGGTLLASSVNITTVPSNGTASVNTSDGSITYAPNAGYTGIDTFQYTVGDSTGATSAPATITVNVSATPIGNPIVANLAETVGENASVLIDVVSSATDTSATLDPATVTVTVPPAHGSTAVNTSTGAITYTPAVGYHGSDAFQYTIGDSLMAVSPAGLVTLTVVTGAPVAATITAPPINAYTATTVYVVGQATDANGNIDPTSVKITTPPTGGVATVNSATGVITYTPNDGFIGSDSLTYTLSDNAHATSAPATITFNTGVTINATTAKSLSFTDSAGDKIRMAITGGGSALVTFNGTGTDRVIPGPHGTGSLVVTGTGLSIAAIVINNSGINGTLSVTSAGAGLASLGTITVNGPLGRIVAPTSALTGNLSVAGSLSLLQVKAIANSSISIGSTGATKAGLSISTGHVSSTSVISTTPIRTLRAIDWIETGTPDSIAAPTITSLVTTGNFDAGLNLSGGSPFALNTVRVGGAISGDTWSVTGNTNSVIVGSANANWTANLAGNVNGITIRAGGFGGTISTGAINSLTITGDDTGTINAASIKSARIVGQLNGANLNLTNGVVPRAYSLNRLVVTGQALNSDIDSAGNIGSIAVAGMNTSNIDAGVNSSVDLPAQASDFAATASIGSVTITGRGSTFADSNIAAMTLGPINLGLVMTTSANLPFGIAAGTIQSLIFTLDTGGGLQRLSGLLLLSGNSIATYVAANNLNLNEFVIRPGL
jgi:hypothetical protein